MQKIQFKLAAFFMALLLAVSCTGKKKPAEKTVEQQDTIPLAIEKSTPENTGLTNHALMFLGEEKGNYPSAFGMLQNEELKSRLSELMKKESDELFEFWNVETPLEVENNIVYTSGCQQHNCPLHHYVLVVNLALNSINVYAFENNQLKLYTEKGVLELPEKFAKSIEIQKSNAGVTHHSTQIISLVND